MPKTRRHDPGLGFPLAAALALLLAGCAGAPAPDASATSTQAEEAGTLTGRVLDDEFLPVPAATVTVVGPNNRSATTDEDGRFALGHVPAGEVRLHVAKAGFQAQDVHLRMEPGQSLDIEVLLPPLPASVPYHETVILSGRFECSMAALDVLWSACLPGGVQGMVVPDSKNTMPFDKPPGVVDLVHELHWQSASLATGSNLDLSVIARDPQRAACQWYANAFGSSPVEIVVHVGTPYENPASPYPTGTCGDRVLHDNNRQLALLVFASPTYAAGVPTLGLTLQQAYAAYVTLFFHGPAPAGFSAAEA